MSAGQVQSRFNSMEAEKARLYASLESLDSAALNRLPDPSVATWTILQVMSHLALSEKGTLGYIKKKTQDAQTLPSAGLVSKMRVLSLAAVLRSPIRVKAPARLAEFPPTLDAAHVRADWDAVRVDWRAWVDDYKGQFDGRSIFRHPFVGLLGPQDTLMFLEEHLLNHTRQITRIKKSLGV